MTAPSEDRGKPVWAWTPGLGLEHSGSCKFIPFDGAAMWLELSVPIGWSLQSHPSLGVVLMSNFGETLTAYEALCLTASDCGFRIRQEQRIGGTP